MESANPGTGNPSLPVRGARPDRGSMVREEILHSWILCIPSKKDLYFHVITTRSGQIHQERDTFSTPKRMMWFLSRDRDSCSFDSFHGIHFLIHHTARSIPNVVPTTEEIHPDDDWTRNRLIIDY